MNHKPTPLIEAADINSQTNRPDVVFVDARGGVDAYARYLSGHLAGALFFDLESELSAKGADAKQGGRHPLPDPHAFGRLLGRKGITPSTYIIAYDDKSGANAAARFWWMMRAVGHRNIQVIDGGLAAIYEAGLPLSRERSPEGKATSPYPVTDWKLPMADLTSVDAARSANDALVIDVREHYRYVGESEPIDLVAGHIPGAINVPYTSNLQANGKFRSPEVLAAQYKEAMGRREIKNVIVHCGSGVTACHTLLAIEVAGLPAPSLYVGSWSEWSRNEKPISRAENP